MIGPILTFLSAAASGADIEVLELDRGEPMPAGAAGAGYQAAVLSGAGWERVDVERAMADTAAIFAACGVVIRASVVYWLKAPAGFQELDETEQAGLLAPLGDRRPAVMFVNRTTDRDIAYSYLNESPVVSRGTAWITREGNPSCAGPLLAHELGHILLSSSRHSDNPENLMSYGCVSTNITGSRPNTALTDSQCKRLRESVTSLARPGAESGD